MQHRTPWKKLSERYVYKGWRKVLIREFSLPDGRVAEFDILDSPSFVTIMAVTVAGNWVCVRQFRPGPEQFLTGFPEGAVEEGEAAADAARRELLEETGYTADEFLLIKARRSAYTTQTQYFVVALNCRRTAEQILDDSEFIEVMEWSTEELMAKLRSPEDEFNNIDAVYMALDYLEREGEGSLGG